MCAEKNFSLASWRVLTYANDLPVISDFREMPRVPLDPTQAVSEMSPRGRGRHQNAGRSVVRLHILLHDKAAHGVADYHRSSWQAVGN